MAELQGISKANYDRVNTPLTAPTYLEGVRVHGPAHGQVGSVRSITGDRVKRRFFDIAQNIGAPPGTARLTDSGALRVTWPKLGWGDIGNAAGHFGTLALVAPDPGGQVHAWKIEDLHGPPGSEREGTTVFPWDNQGLDIWQTLIAKTHSPLAAQPHGELCALCVCSLTGANLRTNLLPFIWPGSSGGEVEPSPWFPDTPGPQLVMSPDPANLARMSNEQIDAWAQDLLVEHGFDGIDLWLLGQEVNASTVRLLSHPACRIARVVMWTDSQRGGPTDFDTNATRDYIGRIIVATRQLDVTFLMEPSFDLNELSESARKVREFVAIGKGMDPGDNARYLWGGRQHDSPAPLPGDYAAWGDHVTDKAAWAQMCRTTLERAGGLPAGQTDRFRSRSGSTRSKDWPTGEMPDGIRTARRFGVLCSWGFLPDGNHEVGSRPWPNKGEIAAANQASPDDIDDGGGLVARRPKDLLHPWIRVDPAHSAGKDRDRFALTDDPEGRFVAKGWDEPIIVEEVEFWVGCWPEALNEFAVGFHVNRKNVAEFSGHKHYRFTPPSGGGTFTSGHGGQGGVYRDRERVVLPVPLLVKPSEDVIQVSYGQHPEHANHPNGGTHYRVIVRGRKVD